MRRFCQSLCFIGLAATVLAWGQDLSLQDAQRHAVERSRQLAAQDSAVLASREMAVAAGQLPDPVLKLGIDNLPVNGPDRFSTTRDFMTMRRVGIMQELTRGPKRELRAQRFEREAERSLAEKDAALTTIQRETATAWLERYYAEAMARVLAAQVAQARLEVQAAEAAYRGARAGQSDVFAAHSTLAGLEDRSSEFGRRVAVAKTSLARYERDLLPLARDRAQAALASYQGGKTSIADVLGARRNESDVRMQAVQLEMDTARLWAKLNFLSPDHALHDGGRK